MTLNEIAKLACTSPSTVSLAINNRPGVSPSTREKIMQIVAECGYLSRKKEAVTVTPRKLMKLIAVSKPNTSDIHNFRTSFFAEIINSIQNKCSELNYSMMYSIVPHDNFIEEIKNSEISQPSDGIILIGTYLSDSEVDQLENLSFPLVLLDRSCQLSYINSVCINNYMGAYNAVSELISCGHKKIGYVRSSSSVSNLAERHQGFAAALAYNKISIPSEFFFSCNSYIADGVDMLCQQLQHAPSLPTAFFCENDYIALSLISALNIIGLAAPNDFSVIGFDDVPECIITTPQLTTVHVDRQALAFAAVNRLHELITSSNTTTQYTLINVNLVKRSSVNVLSKSI